MQNMKLSCKRFLSGICLSIFLPVVSMAAADTTPTYDALDLAANKLPRLHSILVSQGGELLFEQYYNGRDPQRPANMKSASKSVISALIGIAIDKKLIESVNVKIADYFPELITVNNNAEKLQITIGNLLSMQSGLETTSNRNYGKWILSENWVEFAINQPMVAEPGTRMLYSTGSTHLLSAIISKVSGMSTKQFAQENLTSPLGYSMSYWPQDPQGIYFGGNDMEMTPRQMLSFGELYLNDGRKGEQQIISESWINDSYTPHVRSPRGQGRYYGYGWWLRDLAGMQVPVAWGYGGQLIFVVKELDVVVVATSESTPGPLRRGHLRSLYDLIEDEIFVPLRGELLVKR
ncbi:MAG: 6-aminohexanoate hydrolase [SAR86 cluster bacterium]|uniref:6-aminohexanoate hydrolase n=1 Tax=SAR86 cluster bacterium TaxID=2030880 RepID=A0A2A5AWJ4_9GAMM|nr:MAG: 6-aminohexanoate hydrolase [SAR86 cluster bacterium]